MNSDCIPKCILTADRPIFWEHSGIASYCILAGSLSSFWYVLWLNRNLDSWVHLGINFWMYSKRHSECSSTDIPNALWHGLWLHCGRDPGGSWNVFWLNCNMDSVCNMAGILHASCNGFYTFAHPYILNSFSDEICEHPESSTMWIWSALCNGFSTNAAIKAECMQLWILSASSYGLSAWIRKSILKTTLSSECILT